MGEGKTKMITPCLILRSVYYAILGEKNKYIFVVTPDHLVKQSYDYLLYTLGVIFHIDVKLINEERDKHEFINSLPKDSKFTLCVTSDTSLKCGFLNDKKFFNEKINNIIYIFDEIDTILDPIASELNYSDELYKLDNFNEYFDSLYDIIKYLYKEDGLNKFKEIYRDKGVYDNLHHFKLLDLSKYNEIKDICIYFIKAKKLYTQRIINIIEKNVISGEKLLSNEVNIIYVFTLFLKEVLPSMLQLSLRRDFGSYGNNDKKHIIVPFSHVEQPMVGSQFNNPILVLCLTILEYLLYDKTKYSNEFKEYYCELIKNIYISVDSSCRDTTDIFKQYIKLEIKVPLSELSFGRLSEDDYKKIMDSDFFIRSICKTICSNEITYSKTQSNICGIDLIMSNNTKYKTGFTGTPAVGTFYDIDKEDEIEEPYKLYEHDEATVKRINKMYIHKMKESEYRNIKTVLGKCTMDFTYESSNVKDFITNLISNTYNKYNVIIDVDGICVGINYKFIYEQYKSNLKEKNFKFVYWNKYHDGNYIDQNGNESEWNNIFTSDEKIIYYFDHEHTVGIDTKMPNESYGLILLGNKPRFRNVVQGLYRMRKIGKSQNAMFIGFNYNKFKTIVEFINFIINNEVEYIKKNENLLLLQNLRALCRCCDSSKNDYEMYNVFNFPSNKEPFTLEFNELILNKTNLQYITEINKLRVLKCGNTNIKTNIEKIEEKMRISKNLEYNKLSQTKENEKEKEKEEEKKIEKEKKQESKTNFEYDDKNSIQFLYDYFDIDNYTSYLECFFYKLNLPKKMSELTNTNEKYCGIHFKEQVMDRKNYSELLLILPVYCVIKILSTIESGFISQVDEDIRLHDDQCMKLIKFIKKYDDGNDRKLFFNCEDISNKIWRDYDEIRDEYDKLFGKLGSDFDATNCKYSWLRIVLNESIIVSDTGNVMYSGTNAQFEDIVNAKFLMKYFNKWNNSASYFPLECYEYLFYNKNKYIRSKLMDILQNSTDPTCEDAYNIFTYLFGKDETIEIFEKIIDYYNNTIEFSSLNDLLVGMENKFHFSYLFTDEEEYINFIEFTGDFIYFMTCEPMKYNIGNPFTQA
jgi:hypothetical protein